MASGYSGSHYLAERWFQAQPGAGREDRLVALVPNDQVDEYNAGYPEGTAFIDVAAVMAGEDPGVIYSGTPEDPRPIECPDQL